jgi:hypothetical protein
MEVDRDRADAIDYHHRNDIPLRLWPRLKWRLERLSARDVRRFTRDATIVALTIAASVGALIALSKLFILAIDY